MHDVEAEKGRSKEEYGSQEKKCEVSSEFVAVATSSDSGPVPDGATRIVVVSKQSKSNHSSDKENKVHRPVPETRHKWKEEEERVENANGGDDFSVDEALLVPCGGAFVLMQVLTCQASHNGGEGKLSDAEAKREDVYHKHDGGVLFAVLTD